MTDSPEHKNKGTDTDPFDYRQYIVDTLEFAYGPLFVALIYGVLIHVDASREFILSISLDVTDSLRTIFNGFTLDDFRTIVNGATGLATFLAFPFIICALTKHLCFKARDERMKRARNATHDRVDACFLFLVNFGVLGAGTAVALRLALSKESGPVLSFEGVVLILVALICFAILLATVSRFWAELKRIAGKERRMTGNLRPKGRPASTLQPQPQAVTGFAEPSSLAPQFRTPEPAVEPMAPFRQPAFAQDDWMAILRSQMPLILSLLTPVLSAAFLVTSSAFDGFLSFLFSAIGFTTLFLLFLAFLVSLMTFGSVALNTTVPFVFGAFCLIYLAGSSGWSFWVVAVLVPMVVFTAWAGQRDVSRIWICIAFLVLAFGVAKFVLPQCRTLAGCNLIQGVPLAERSWVAGDEGDTVAAAFDLWNAANDPAPVRIVAAQGGGLYAAYYTASYLALRADAEGDAFLDSLFAISGVSGGSVGAAVFWAIVESGLCDGQIAGESGATCHSDAVKEVLRQDYLSPQFQRFFSWDAIDSVLPISAVLTQPIDRGNRLENVLADRFAECCGFSEEDAPRGLLATPMSASWTPEAGAPMLFLNATDVHTGRRAIASPMAYAQEDGISTRISLEEGRDLTVANAAVMSARFPLISPPGRVLAGDQTRQLVDGGYFDNSGLVTVHDILDAIEPELDGRPVEVIALRIDNGACLSDGTHASGDTNCEDRETSGFFGTPIKTLLAIRGGQEALSI